MSEIKDTDLPIYEIYALRLDHYIEDQGDRHSLDEPLVVKMVYDRRYVPLSICIYYHQYDRTNAVLGRELCKPSYPLVDEDGYTTFQLWCFMELYGDHMGMTLPNVIEPLDIVFDAPTLPSAQTEPCRQVAGKLEPCPFCGNEPTISCFKGKDGWRDRYAVICRYDEGGCGAESGLYHYEAEALEAWNRRVGETDVTV